MADTVLCDEALLQPEPTLPLRALQLKDPMRALGLAVQYLMRHPSFAAMQFGHWARTLVGQIKRGHYLFIVRGEEIVGFVGWALTSEQNAEAWLAGVADVPSHEAATGDCMVVNAWQASSREVNSFILHQFRRARPRLRLVYGKRFYRDGRSRLVKLDLRRRAEAETNAGRTGHQPDQ